MLKRLLQHKNLILFVICLILLSACASNSNEATEDVYKAYQLSEKQRDTLITLLEIFPADADKRVIEETTNQQRLFYAFEILEYINTDHETHIIRNYDKSKESITKTFEEYFGKDTELIIEDYLCYYCREGYLYTYNESAEKFIEEGHGHGYSLPNTYYQIVGAKENDEYVLVDVKFIFTELVGEGFDMPMKIYTTVKDAFYEENLLVDISGSNYCDEYGNCDYERVLEDYIDKVNTYSYTFKKEGDNLIFVKYELNS